MINKGELVDQLGGAPKDPTKLQNFFEKAKGLGSGDGEAEAEAGESTESGGTIETRTLASGVVVEILNEGKGVKVPPGAQVSVHYTGKLTNGKVFDSSVSRGEPI